MLRVLAFTKTSEIGPSSRYRYLQMAPHLNRAGVELRCRPLFGPTWFAILRRGRFVGAILKCFYAPARFLVRLADLITMGRPDLVVIEHQLFPYLPAWVERWLRWRGQPFTIEFDDAIFLTRFHLKKMGTLCTLATRVVVGNQELSRFALRYSRKVSVVPTTIEVAHYPLCAGVRPDQTYSPDRPFVIGWIGLPYNFDALKLVQEPLRRMASVRPILLRVVSVGAPHLPGVPMEAIPWSAGGECAQVESFDVGIMPLRDDAWSRGKCALKILQYFAAGRPAIASPVGANEDVIRHGENGFLARDDDEWLDALNRVFEDPALAAALGQRARDDVENRYSAHSWAPRLADAWRAAASGQGDAA